MSNSFQSPTRTAACSGRLPQNSKASCGVFAPRAAPAPAYELPDGKARELKRLTNPEDISRLVVFDTWTLNCDRHAPNNTRKPNRNNVFLSEETSKEELLLRAMDHPHCFALGTALTNRIAHLDRVHDPDIYGLFPEFREFLDLAIAGWSVNRLQQADRQLLVGLTSRYRRNGT